jgi:hypothetical protein
MSEMTACEHLEALELAAAQALDGAQRVQCPHIPADRVIVGYNQGWSSSRGCYVDAVGQEWDRTSDPGFGSCCGFDWRADEGGYQTCCFAKRKTYAVEGGL